MPALIGRQRSDLLPKRVVVPLEKRVEVGALRPRIRRFRQKVGARLIRTGRALQDQPTGKPSRNAFRPLDQVQPVVRPRQLLVPLDKAVESVNWRTYGILQPKDSLPLGPYVFAVSVTSPFIKFKNASKETIDGGDDLIEEIRRALMQAGQKLSRHIRAEHKAADLERKIQHIEKFGPILVEGLARIVGAPKTREAKAEEGLKKLLGRDASDLEKAASEAESKLQALKERERKRLGEDVFGTSADVESAEEVDGEDAEVSARETTKKSTTKKTTKKSTVKSATTKKKA